MCSRSNKRWNSVYLWPMHHLYRFWRPISISAKPMRRERETKSKREVEREKERERWRARRTEREKEIEREVGRE